MDGSGGESCEAELEIVQGDNLEYLAGVSDQAFQLVYIDPPFNTGKARRLQRLKTERAEDGTRRGFGGKRYRAEVVSDKSYGDRFDDYLRFLGPRLEQVARVLDATGSLFVHLDPRESHYVKVFLDELFGRECFQNEIVWAYDYGARSKRRWSTKHDTILWYARDPERYTYRYDDIDRIPYMAPGLGGEGEGRARQDTDRCLVADDREPHGQGTDRLPDAEAEGDPRAHRARALEPR